METKTTTIYLLRHGKVDGAPALYGQTDIEVTDAINQIILNDLNAFQQNTDAKISQVISSPLKRCYKVAKQFSTINELPFTTVSAFQEIHFGQFDGVSFDSISDKKNSDEAWQQLENFWQNPDAHPLPDAELLAGFYQRVKTAWHNMLDTYPTENILLVSHGGVIRMILSYLLDIDHGNSALFSQLTIKNNSITLIRKIQVESNIHNNVEAISIPLKCLSQYPAEFK